MRLIFIYLLVLIALPTFSFAQHYSISGKIVSEESRKPVYASVCIKPLNNCVITNENGDFIIKNLSNGIYILTVTSLEYETVTKTVDVNNKNFQLTVGLSPRTGILDSVTVNAINRTFGLTHLKDVDGAGIYAGQKSEVIIMKDLVANTATNNARQIYGKVAGLNIFESDGGAGLQLSIGGRGLDPNRTSNFNTRQNGYDISADALGYPESYYTPPAEMVEKIEVVRGAAALQFGTQFGGIINFKLKDGADTSKMQVISRLSGGSWNFFNTSTSIGGTNKKWKYFAFYQHKSGNGWRAHSKFNANTAYLSTTYKASKKVSITTQFTHMDYLEQQPGGLSDAMFAANPDSSTKARNWFKVNWNLGAVLLNYDITNNLKFDSRTFGLLASRSALGVTNTVIDPGVGWPRNYRTDNYTNWGTENRLIYNYNKKNDNPSVLLLGMRFYNGYTNRQVGYGNGGSGPDFSFDKSTPYDSLSYSHYTFPNHNLALFVENIFKINSKLSIIPGVRYENIVTKADGFYNNPQEDLASQYTGIVSGNTLVTQDKTSKRSFLIGGIGLSYNRNNEMNMYANFTQNYRGINFNDMSIVNPNVYVNPNLKDEKGYSADIGVRGSAYGFFTYDVSLFTIYYADRIGVVQIDTLGINAQYTDNISASRNIGVESFGEIDLLKLIEGNNAKAKLSIFSNLSYINARYVGSQESAYQNKKVELVPATILRTGITYQKNKFRATYQYSYVSKQFGDATNSPTPSNNGINGPIPSYYVMDLSADYIINKLLTVSGSINNLSNNKYYTRRAESYPGPGIIPADPRSFYLTFQVKF